MRRNPEKVAALAEQVKAAGGGGRISAYTYDLSSFAEVRKLAEAVKADHKNINVLINNAGVFSKQKAMSHDGIEMTWAVNMLAPFLLTSLLLDGVKERIVNVGSMALASSMDFDNLQQVVAAQHWYTCKQSLACLVLPHASELRILGPCMLSVLTACQHSALRAMQALQRILMQHATITCITWLLRESFW